MLGELIQPKTPPVFNYIIDEKQNMNGGDTNKRKLAGKKPTETILWLDAVWDTNDGR